MGVVGFRESLSFEELRMVLHGRHGGPFTKAEKPEGRDRLRPCYLSGLPGSHWELHLTSGCWRVTVADVVKLDWVTDLEECKGEARQILPSVLASLTNEGTADPVG